MKLVRVILGVLLIAAIACGKKNDKQDEATPEPTAAPEATPDEPSGGPPEEAVPEPDPGGEEAMPANPLAPTGANVDRMCDWYGDSKAEKDGEAAKPKAVESCKKTLAARKPDERQKIADCANACGDMESVADCFDDFGKDSFPACEPERGDDDDDGEGDE